MICQRLFLCYLIYRDWLSPRAIFTCSPEKIYAPTNINIHKYKHKYTHIYIRTHTIICTYRNMSTKNIQKYAHTYAHKNLDIHNHTHTQICIKTNIYCNSQRKSPRWHFIKEEIECTWTFPQPPKASPGFDVIPYWQYYLVGPPYTAVTPTLSWSPD